MYPVAPFSWTLPDIIGRLQVKEPDMQTTDILAQVLLGCEMLDMDRDGNPLDDILRMMGTRRG